MADILLIKNGLVISADNEIEADVLAIDGQIEAVASGLEPPDGAQVVEAGGMLVIPGGVDVHTHLDLSVGQAHVSDGWKKGGIAAAYGGTTCIVEHPGFGPAGCPLNFQLNAYRENAVESVIDYGLHGVFQHWDENIKAEAAAIIKAGYPSFKVYMTYDGRLDDESFLAALKTVGEAGGLITVHAENHAIVSYLKHELAESAPHLASSHPKSRPDYSEALAVETAIRLAEAAGDMPVYIVHLSTADGLKAIRKAKMAGKKVWAETCPQYLALTDECYKGDFDQALKFVMAPTPRKKRDVEAMWEGLIDGTISTLATDHCSFGWQDKKNRAEGNVFKCPGGIPGVETRLPILYSEGVLKRGLSRCRWVELVSTAPARLFGLNKKGRLAPGFDADIVIFDPEAEKKLAAEKLHQAVDYTPFENMIVRGWPVMVFSHGKKIVDGERFMGEPGQGRFVARQPFCP